MYDPGDKVLSAWAYHHYQSVKKAPSRSMWIPGVSVLIDLLFRLKWYYKFTHNMYDNQYLIIAKQ